MYRAKCNADEGIFKGVKKMDGKNTPIGYKETEIYFVDASGFGSENEPALTASQFLAKVKAGHYYAITNAGQFQVYITEYEKITGSRKALYKELGIVKSKIVRNNTRLTEYEDGRRTLRLHATDIITWKPDGKMILTSGGWRTHTTKERLNEYLPDYMQVYQRKFKWYIIDKRLTDWQNKRFGEIEFVDGMEL